MTVTTQCADNAHIRSGSSLNVTCVSNGSWSGQTLQCECDVGHHNITTIDGRQICLLQGEQPHNHVECVGNIVCICELFTSHWALNYDTRYLHPLQVMTT